MAHLGQVLILPNRVFGATQQATQETAGHSNCELGVAAVLHLGTVTVGPCHVHCFIDNCDAEHNESGRRYSVEASIVYMQSQKAHP